jgi:hypothetical protein
MMLIELATVLALSGPARTVPECLHYFLDRANIVRIAAASDATTLRQLYRSLPYADNVLEAVYAVRLFELEPGPAAREALLRSVPRSQLELAYLYSITYPDLLPETIANLFDKYLEVLARAVEVEHRGFREYLLLKRFADGEVAETLSEWNEFLFERDRKRFMEALRSLDKEGQRLVCGDCQVLSDPSAKQVE